MSNLPMMNDIFSFVDNYNPNRDESTLDRLVLNDTPNATSPTTNNEGVPNLEAQEINEESIPLSSPNTNTLQTEAVTSKDDATNIEENNPENTKCDDNGDNFFTVEVYPLPYSQCGPEEGAQPTPFMKRNRARSAGTAKQSGVWTLDFVYKCLHTTKDQSDKQAHKDAPFPSSPKMNEERHDGDNGSLPEETITFPATNLDDIEVDRSVQLGRKLQLIIGLLIKEERSDQVMEIPEVVDLVPSHLRKNHPYNPQTYRRIIQNEKARMLEHPREYDHQPEHDFEARIHGWSVVMCDRRSSSLRDMYFSTPLMRQRLRSFKEVISYILYEKRPEKSSKKRPTAE